MTGHFKGTNTGRCRPLLVLVVALLALWASHPIPCVAATSVNGTISVNTTWTEAASPYVVASNLTVAAGATLALEPGVIVKASAATLTINGTLHADASGGAPIVFTSLKDDTAGWDTNNDGYPRPRGL
jgi:hypothetical protein